MLSRPAATSVLRMSIPAYPPVPAAAPDTLPGIGTVPIIGADDAARASITIVLADDHQVVRSGLRMLLEAEDGFEVLGEAGNVTAALQEVLDRRPHVLILDLNMSGESSLSAIPRLRRESPGTQVVVLTMQDELVFAREALRAGALGYVLKDAADAELVRAVRSAAKGHTYLNPRLKSRLTAEPPQP